MSTALALEHPVAAEYREGDCCSACGYWYWQSDGHWHSLVPILWADTQDDARRVRCPKHQTRLLMGKLQPDRKGWDEYVMVGPTFVKHWIWDVLAEMPAGSDVRIMIDVEDYDAPAP